MGLARIFTPGNSLLNCKGRIGSGTFPLPPPRNLGSLVHPTCSGSPPRPYRLSPMSFLLHRPDSGLAQTPFSTLLKPWRIVWLPAHDKSHTALLNTEDFVFLSSQPFHLSWPLNTSLKIFKQNCTLKAQMAYKSSIVFSLLRPVKTVVLMCTYNPFLTPHLSDLCTTHGSAVKRIKQISRKIMKQ